MFGYDEGEVPDFIFASLRHVTQIYCLLTVLNSFGRPDFLNLTICGVAMFQFSNLNTLRKSSFRYLVAGLFLSFIYDLFWLVLNWQEYEDDLAESEEAGGKTELAIK